MSPTDGWVAVEFAVVLKGKAEVKVEKDGAAGIEVGLFAAHCWPKEEGKYWQVPRFSLERKGTEKFDNTLLSLRATFPVSKGVKYSFGVGLTTTAWARGDAAAGVRLWSRLAHAVIKVVEKPKGGLPYTEKLQ